MTADRKHLHRLDTVRVPNPIYFITTCTHGRARRLATDTFHALAVEVWRN